jgi:hypothetical protein
MPGLKRNRKKTFKKKRPGTPDTQNYICEFHFQMGASGASARPGYPLQFLGPPIAGLRDFRFYPLRFAVR